MSNYRCCVGGCNNDSRYPDKIVKRSHVKELKFHHFLKDESKRQLWKEQVDKGLDGFIVSDNKVVCSNHFEYGKPTYASPVQTMFMNIRKALEPSPKKRRTIIYEKPAFDNNQSKDCPSSAAVETTKGVEVQCSIRIAPAMIFADLARDCDVNYFTSLRNIDAFRLVFDYLSEKAK